MATHSSVLAWRIPGTEEPSGLPSVGSQSRTRLKRLSSSSSNSNSTSSCSNGKLSRTQAKSPHCLTEGQHSTAYGVVRAKSLQSGPTLCNPMDCTPPGSSVYGIL